MNIVSTDFYEAHGTTMCVITAIIDGEQRTFSGAANLHPDDRHRPAVGREIAQARAYTNLAARLTRRARGMVKHQDDLADRNALLGSRGSRIVTSNAVITHVASSIAAGQASI